MSDKTIVWGEQALATARDMQDKVQSLGRHFGEHSPEHAKAAASLARVMLTINMTGFADKAEVSRDGDLSLYVVEGGFHYGIIWFRDRAFDGQSAPQPGTWSVHS